MLAFTAAVFFLIVTPGPGVLSAAGVGASFGYRPGFNYLAGLFVGTNIVALLVVSGVAAAVLANPALRTFLMAASTAYLLYIALKIAFAGARIGFIHPERAPGLRDGLLLQFINPKAYAVNTALFSGFPMAMALGAETLVKFLIINVIWIPIHLAWLGAGVAVQRMELPPRTQRIVNILMATSMLAVVGLAFWQGFLKGAS